VATATAEQVLVGYDSAVALVRARVQMYADLVWSGSSSYHDSDVDRIVAQIAPKVQAGQLQIANLTSAYIASAASVRRGERIMPVPVNPEVTRGRGVPAIEVYRRPAKTLYRELSKGKTFDVALAAGASRLGDLVMMDLQMAKVRQASASYSATGAQFYGRVLTGLKNCALCVIASTQRYRSGDLMPIHPGCNCGVKELEDGAEEQTLDLDLLRDTHEQVEKFGGASDSGGRAPDYRQMIVTREHGEYGPTLTWRDQKFTGPDDLAA